MPQKIEPFDNLFYCQWGELIHCQLNWAKKKKVCLTNLHSIWRHFCCTALRAEPNFCFFYLFFSCQGKMGQTHLKKKGILAFCIARFLQKTKQTKQNKTNKTKKCIWQSILAKCMCTIFLH